jgi:hypothetical protein
MEQNFPLLSMISEQANTQEALVFMISIMVLRRFNWGILGMERIFKERV